MDQPSLLSSLLMKRASGPMPTDPNQGEIRNLDDPYYGTGGPSLPAKLAYMLSGIPTAIEGMKGAREGSLAGDPVKAFGGLGQTAIAAIPAMGKAAAPLFATAPRLAAMLTAGTVAPMAAGGALSPSPAEAAPADPIQQFYEDRAKLSDQISAAEQAMAREARTGKGPRFQQAEQELRALGSKKDALDLRIQAMEHENSPEAAAERQQRAYEQKQANEKAELDKPFAERHPHINEVMTLAGPTLAGMLSFGGMRMIANKGNRLLTELIEARKAGDITTMREAAAKLEQWNKPVKRYAKQAAAIGLPATLPMDMRLLGDNFDKYNLPKDSKAQQAAKARLDDIPQYIKDSEQALVSGLVMSATGGKLGAMTAGGTPAGDAKAMLSLYGGKEPDSLAEILKKGAAESTGVQEPLALLQKAQTARSDAAASAARRSRQLDSGDALVQGGAPAPPATPAVDVPNLPSQPLPHHSARQPRNKRGRFTGAPLKPDND